MKRIALLSLTAVLLLSGCAAPAGEPAPGNQGGSTGPSAGTDSPSGPLTYFETYSGVGTREGYYYLTEEVKEDADGRNYLSLLYLDYATRQEVYLCNKPDCAHDNDRCSAYIAAEIPGDCSLLAWEDKLYLFCSSYTVGMSVGDGYTGNGVTSAVPPALYRLNRDGTGREKVAELSSGQVFGSAVLLAKGPYLYAAVETLVSKSSDDGGFVTTEATDSTLMEFDSRSGAARQVCSLKEQRVIGAYDDRLVILRTLYPVDPDTLQDDDEAYMENLRSSTQLILLADPRTGGEKEVLRAGYDEIGNLCLWENRAYYGAMKKGVIRWTDLDTGEGGILTDQLPAGNLNYSTVHDGKIRVEYWEDKYLNAAQTGCRYVDVKTGAITELSLTTTKPREWVNVLSDAGEDFLIVSDYLAEEEYVAWAGVTQTNITGRRYALIRKEDFWSSKAQYREIQPAERTGS
jgi:hypothetical protein